MVAKSPAVQRKNASAAKRNITRTVSSVANTLGPKETMNVAGKFFGHIEVDPDLFVKFQLGFRTRSIFLIKIMKLFRKKLESS